MDMTEIFLTVKSVHFNQQIIKYIILGDVWK